MTFSRIRFNRSVDLEEEDRRIHIARGVEPGAANREARFIQYRQLSIVKASFEYVSGCSWPC
jgi:hypothetical protein